MSEKTKVSIPQQPERLKVLLADPKIKSRFEEMLGKRSAGFISSILSVVTTNKSLAACEPMSIIQSAAIAAAIDLPINPNLGFACIVPYKDVAQFQIQWKGFVQLALRTNQYKTINVTPVLEGQLVSRNSFTGEMFFQEAATSEKHIGYLLYFKLIYGYEKFFYMTTQQCYDHGKRYSKSFQKNYGMWVDDFEAMALKTVAKMGLSKYGILSIELQTAFETDQGMIDDDGKATYIDAVTPEAEEKKSEAPKQSRLSKIVTPKVEEPFEKLPFEMEPLDQQNPKAGDLNEEAKETPFE